MSLHFAPMKVCVIGTKHVLESDLPKLLDVDTEYHCYNHDMGAASIFFLPSDGDEWADARLDWKEQGLSEVFINIMEAAYVRGFHFVCFDRDA